MLFNSTIFILVFLPIVVSVYFLISRLQWIRVSKIWLVAASLFFYSWWNINYLPLIILSIVVNFYISQALIKADYSKKVLLISGLVFNLGLLGYFKYVDFLIVNVNWGSGSDFQLLQLALPLAISFYTLQQIAYLVDSYGKLIKEKSFLDYMLFVTFFPQLIAGPIVHHKEMMPQFAGKKNKALDYNNIASGAFVFSIGLFKKVVIADTFAQWATAGHANADMLNLVEAWITSLSYTFQLYFDFSGYTDMAIGAALLFNIRLPRNFNSPYQAKTIVEFWSRWHITLTRFLTNYIYEPIVKSFHTFSFHGAMFATFVTMIVAGIWHGAAWTFLLFGFVHGIAMIINHYWKKAGKRLPGYLAWFLAFNFLNSSFVIFRADSIENAYTIIKAMFGFNGITSADDFAQTGADTETLQYILLAFIAVLLLKNSGELLNNFKTSSWNLLFTVVLLFSSLSMMSKVSEFLYFNF